MPNEELREKVPAFAGEHEPQPLPFDPAKLRGLSQRAWGVGPAQELARGPRAALDRTATRLGAR